MQAMLFSGPGKLELLDVPRPECPPGGALIRVESLGLFEDDLGVWRNGPARPERPLLAGRGVSGRLEEFSGPLPGFKAGARVHAAPLLGCGICPQCREGRQNLCPEAWANGLGWSGGLAGYLALPAGSLTSGAVAALPPGLDHDLAALAEPLARALNALERAGLRPGERVAVLGAGAEGRITALAAEKMGAGEVALADVSPRNLQGIDFPGVDASGGEPARELNLALGGAPRVAVPACGGAWALELGLKALDTGGRLVLNRAFSGAFRPDMGRLHLLEQALIGVQGSTAAQNRRALRLLAADPESFQGIITHRLPLSKAREGLELLERKEALQVVLKPRN